MMKLAKTSLLQVIESIRIHHEIYEGTCFYTQTVDVSHGELLFHVFTAMAGGA